jgi:hypothetical protein
MKSAQAGSAQEDNAKFIEAQEQTSAAITVELLPHAILVLQITSAQQATITQLNPVD